MPRQRPNRITPRSIDDRVTEAVSAALAKALPVALSQAGGAVRTGDAAIQALRAQQTAQRGQLAQPLPRDEYPYAFGPNVPLAPAPLDPVGASGRAEPRLWEYPVSWNLPGVGGRHIPWRVLRDAAEHPLIRQAITVRKEEVAGLDWDWSLAPRAVDEAMRDDPNASRLDIERDLRERLRPDIARLREFWTTPDRGNGLTFPEWTSQFLEEHFVLDALPVYPRYTVGGQLYSFEVVDGSTIKPLMDHRGGRPLPPQPAYQQNIHGFPRGEFTADTSDNGGQIVIPNAYRADQLIYIRREVRVASPYGLSAVEKCLTDLSLWMKRQEWIRDEYDSGVSPAGWLRWLAEDNTAGWTAGQIAEYERELNDYYSGNTANRHRWRILPPGLIPDESNGRDQAEKYKPEFDLFLMKLVVGHFSVTVHELGFPEQQGIGGQGHAEGQERLGERKGRLPTLRWLASLFTDMSRAHLVAPPELQFTWLNLEDDEDGEEPIPVTELTGAALMTLNEGRDEDGRTRYTFPEADKPFIVTGTGQLVFIEGAEKRQEEEKAAAQEAAAAQLQALQAGKPAAGKPKPDEGGGEPAKRAEAKAYRRWSTGSSARRFVAKHLTADDADTYGLDPDRIEFAEVADVGKASWAWGRDQQVADHWAPLLNEAVLQAVPVHEVAMAWVGAQAGLDATKGLGGAAKRAARWLAGRAVDLARPIARVIGGIHSDGATVGAAQADEALGRPGTDWDAWKPGHPAAAEHVVGASGVGDELRDLLADAGVTISSVAQHRFDDMAQVLADGIARGDNADTIAKALEGVLAKPQWARLVAETETTRAASAAAMDNYRNAGIAAATWETGPDQRVCDLCDANAKQGPVALGERFSSGDRYPPGHPRCRCALVPHISVDDL